MKIFSLLLLTVATIALASADLATSARVPSEIPFPDGFWWGTALSGHQSEGGNNNSWTRWEEIPGHIEGGQRSGNAIDHWNRFETDFDWLKWMNGNVHRFSVEWSRFEPKQGEWDEKAIEHYRAMALALKARGIRPMVCLFHFTLPLWVEGKGGFENQEVIDAFVRFAEKAHAALGDVVQDWLTLNEPIFYAFGGYGVGNTPPGVKDFKRGGRVYANLMHIHGRIYHLFKNLDRRARVSLAHPVMAFSPYHKFNPLDVVAARGADDLLNWTWIKSIQTGRIEINLPTKVHIEEECPECLNAMDFLGLNYYTRNILEVTPFGATKITTRTHKGAPHTDVGWEIYPEGLSKILHGIKSRGLDKYPIVVTENGLADVEDKNRAKFIYDHLRTFLEVSRELGLKPMGYMHWSLIDNFEWLKGFGPRFGLIAVDYRTMERSPRPSAAYFREMGRLKKVFPPSFP